MGVTASRDDEYSASENPDVENALPGTSPRLHSGDRKPSSLANITSTDFIWSFGGSSVYVTGAWDDWRLKTSLSRTTQTDHTVVLSLPLGTFQYKFIVDGNWK